MIRYKHAPLLSILCIVWMLSCKSVPMRAARYVQVTRPSSPHLAEAKAVSQTMARDLVASYYFGDGLGMNCILKLTGNGIFTFEFHTDVGEVGEHNEGGYRLENAVLLLSPKHPNNPKEPGGTATQFFPIRWGQRLYLIPTDQVIDLCNEINSGSEPRTDIHGRFYLREGDEKKPVTGYPDLPQQWRRYLHSQPIVGKVIRVEKNGDAVVNVGHQQGLKSGMELYDWTAGPVCELIVISSNETTATVRKKDQFDTMIWPENIEVGDSVTTNLYGKGLSRSMRRMRAPKELAPAQGAKKVGELEAGPIAYWWLSNTEILDFHYSTKPPYNQKFLVRRNLTTGKAQTLFRLSTLYNDSGGDYLSTNPSPDGKWLLWGDQVCMLDGSHAFHWPSNPQEESGNIHWMGDGQRLIRFIGSTDEANFHAVIRHVDAPQTTQTLALNKTTRAALKGYNEDTLRFTADSRVLAADWDQENHAVSSVRIIEAVMGPNARPPQEYRISLPAGALLYNIVFSPSGDKVAWQLAFEKQHTVALWLSHIDGSRMHALQDIKLGADDPPDIAVQPYSVQWMPNGKSVSYVFNYRLYSVPAE